MHMTDKFPNNHSPTDHRSAVVENLLRDVQYNIHARSRCTPAGRTRFDLQLGRCCDFLKLRKVSRAKSRRVLDDDRIAAVFVTEQPECDA